MHKPATSGAYNVVHDQQKILYRDQLEREFNSVLTLPLVIAVAAVGYGKSTSARTFLERRDIRYIWTSVDEKEASEQYLWSIITSQMQVSAARLGADLSELGFPSDASRREEIVKLLREAAVDEPLLLVIDDYHHVNSSDFDRLIEHLVRVNIPGFHLLLLSRTVPGLPVEEFLIKGSCRLLENQVFEVGKQEIISYFALHKLEITESEAEKIHIISEGWMAALYLIMQHYRQTGRIETGGGIERLIETTSMTRYSEFEITLLKSLCFFDRFSAAQAAYVTDLPITDRVMQSLIFGNSFISYDSQTAAYRIHHIFRSYLQNRFGIDQDTQRAGVLYARSGRWHVQQGDLLTGLRHLLRAEDYEQALELFEDNSITLMLDRNTQLVVDLFEHIPLEVQLLHPIAALTYIGFYVTNIDKQQGNELLGTFIDRIKASGMYTEEVLRKIHGEAQLIRAYTHFNDADTMHTCMKEAHSLLDGRSAIANRDKIITFGSPHALYLYYRTPGQLRYAAERVIEMFPCYSQLAGGCGRGFDNLMEAEYYLETGSFELAELHALRAYYKAESLQQLEVMINAQFVMARLRLAEGAWQQARDITHGMSQQVSRKLQPILKSTSDICGAYVAGILCEQQGFAPWIREGSVSESRVLYQGMGFNYVVFGMYLLHTERFVKLEVLCDQMQEAFSVFSNQLGLLHMHLLRAAAVYRLYGTAAAMPALRAAVEIGRKDAILLPFGEYSHHILDVLMEMKDLEPGDRYLEEVAAFALDYVTKLIDTSTELKLRDSLSQREREVLRLIAAGHTNAEIASRLCVAEVTVRKNVTALYRKLEVTGRSLAVKKAIELGIT